VKVFARLAEIVAAHGGAALVSVHEIRGSAPRGKGARMILRPDGGFHGTIGGGELEWRFLGEARDMLARGRGPARFVRQALGPDLGQCCGGHVSLLIETFGAEDVDALCALAAAEAKSPREVACRFDADGRVERVVGVAANAAEWTETVGESGWPVVLFGAGHVGRALVMALAPLPFSLRWIDEREDAFPSYIPANATPVRAADPLAELEAAPDNALVVVMTHSHPLDLALTAAALARPVPFVGLIGSKTKRARFEKRFREIGIPETRLRDLACPIGLAAIRGKEPAIIAASVAAQLLEVLERLSVPVLSEPARKHA
jgi:xanthine dehydrogenase accessory factor